MKTLLTAAAAVATLSLSPNPPALADAQKDAAVTHQAPLPREPRVTREARLRQALRQSSTSLKEPRWVREARLRAACRMPGYRRIDG